MSGEHESEGYGQLAIMDAVIFFAVAILISSVVLSFPEREGDYEEGPQPFDTALMLESVLSASIGSNLTVETDRVFQIGQRTPVRDCLAVEASCLFRGGEPAGFTELNEVVMNLLRSCAPLSLDPHLIIVYRSYAEPLLALPHLPGRENDCMASSITLGLEEGTELLLVLVLCPSFPSELGQV